MFEMSGLENDQVAVVRGKRGGSRMVGPLERQPGDDEATGGEKGNAQCGQSPENWTPAYGRIQNPLLAPEHPHTFHSLTHTQQRNSD